MFGALQLPDKGCTLHLIICIMMLSEGAVFEYAGGKVIPDSDQIKVAAVRRICSLSQEGEKKSAMIYCCVCHKARLYRPET